MTSELSNNIGLHSGTSGVALFLAYYNRIMLGKNEISPRIMDILEHNIQQIDSGKSIFIADMTADDGNKFSNDRKKQPEKCLLETIVCFLA